MENKITSKDIKAMLARRYSPPAFAYFSEVANTTGAAARYADGIAYSLFASTGFEMNGFEIKISRADFLNELKNPAKSDEIMKYCDKWWIVCPSKMIDKRELPPTWGLMEVRGNKLVMARPAPLLKSVSPDRAFIAALLRRSTEGVIPRELLWKSHQMAVKQARADLEQDHEREKTILKEKLKKFRDFEERSGIRIADGWHSGKELGEVIEKLSIFRYSSLGNYVKGALEDLNKVLKILKTLHGIEKIDELLKK